MWCQALQRIESLETRQVELQQQVVEKDQQLQQMSAHRDNLAREREAQVGGGGGEGEGMEGREGEGGARRIRGVGGGEEMGGRKKGQMKGKR